MRIYESVIIVYMSQTIQAFQLGTSTVITLPKKLGIKPGQKLEITKDKQKIVLKINASKKSDVVDQLAGKLKLDAHLSPEALNKLFDESYE